MLEDGEISLAKIEQQLTVRPLPLLLPLVLPPCTMQLRCAVSRFCWEEEARGEKKEERRRGKREEQEKEKKMVIEI